MILFVILIPFQAFVISSSVLAFTHAYPKADFGGHKGKVCTLEKSATKTKADCFYEPECEDVCKDVTKNVRVVNHINTVITLIIFVGV